MKIGDVELSGRAVLGPMAGFTDMAFRALCMEQGACLCVSEMVSAKGLYYGNKNSLPLLEVGKGGRPVALQLFGSEPKLMAGEALKLEDGPYDIFDINMGCPMPKIVNNGEGSALMLNPGLAEKIVSEMSRTLKKPVTVKIRKGFDGGSVNAVEFAKRMEGAGAAAIAVHGRTREEYYSGKADWEIIRRVKDAVSVPVIGSGDVTGAKAAADMIEQTGCDAVMAARSARGNPWIFREINAYLAGDPVPLRPSLDEVKAMIFRQFTMMTEHAGEYSAVRQMRKNVGFYSAGFANSAALRRTVNQAETAEEFIAVIKAWK